LQIDSFWVTVPIQDTKIKKINIGESLAAIGFDRPTDRAKNDKTRDQRGFLPL